MKKYNVLKNIWANFIIWDIIRIKDWEVEIKTWNISTCSIEFLLDEWYIKEKKEEPKFRIWEKVNIDWVFTVITWISYNVAFEEFYYGFACGSSYYTESTVRKLTDYELWTYF